MASLLRYKSHKYDLSNVNSFGDLDALTRLESRKPKDMYIVFGDNGEPWIEAFQFLISKSHLNSKTILSNAKDLAAYLTFLEHENISWLHFPKRKSERCLYRFREYLIDSERVSDTRLTEQRRINLIISFYKWADHEGFIDKEIEKWDEQNVSVSFYNDFGFKRSMSIASTDLRISTRKSNTGTVEGGLMPLHPNDRDRLIIYLRKSASATHQMLLHMFSIGFWGGARSETIRTLGVSNLEKAKKAHPLDKNIPQLVYLSVGGNTGVKTKYGVQGYLRIPEPVFSELYSYAYSSERLLRGAKARANGKDEDILFLSKYGNPISEDSFTALMSELRARLVADGLTQFHNLKFHQSRATCGTELASMMLKDGGTDMDAIGIVRDWLMHKEESTTWMYIKFVHNYKWTKEFADNFMAQFLGHGFTSGVADNG